MSNDDISNLLVYERSASSLTTSPSWTTSCCLSKESHAECSCRGRSLYACSLVDGGVVELDRLIGKQPCGDFVDSRGDWHRYEYWKDTESELSELGTAEAPAALTQHWIDTIAEAALSGDRPRHNTAVEYVRGAASSLSFAARTLGAERGLSLDPDD